MRRGSASRSHCCRRTSSASTRPCAARSSCSCAPPSTAGRSSGPGEEVGEHRETGPRRRRPAHRELRHLARRRGAPDLGDQRLRRGLPAPLHLRPRPAGGQRPAGDRRGEAGGGAAGGGGRDPRRLSGRAGSRRAAVRPRRAPARPLAARHLQAGAPGRVLGEAGSTARGRGPASCRRARAGPSAGCSPSEGRPCATPIASREREAWAGSGSWPSPTGAAATSPAKPRPRRAPRSSGPTAATTSPGRSTARS